MIFEIVSENLGRDDPARRRVEGQVHARQRWTWRFAESVLDASAADRPSAMTGGVALTACGYSAGARAIPPSPEAAKPASRSRCVCTKPDVDQTGCLTKPPAALDHFA